MKPTTAREISPKLVSLRLVAVVTLLDGLFFSLVSPTSGNSLLIIVGCALLAAGVYGWCALIIRLIASFWPFALRSQRALAIFSVLAVMFLILMQSIGQLSWRDVLATLPLAIVLYLYMSYRAGGRTARPTG